MEDNIKRIFNSEHDFCLANNDISYVPSESAVHFSGDCAPIMRYLEDSAAFPFIVWGWDKALKHRLLKEGVDPVLLPSDEYLDQVRALSHRRETIRCLSSIKEKLAPEETICDTAPVEVKTFEDVLRTVNEYKDTILKSPWSSSGKGLRMVNLNSWTESDKGWVRNIIAKQGSLIVEKRARPVLDFSMQFATCAESVKFWGYSIFKATHGAYQGNLLASNEYMETLISGYIKREMLLHVREAISEFLLNEFVGKYEGNLGVDMFIDQSQDGCHCLNPCVEINVRNNFGLVARLFADRCFLPKHPLEDGTYQMSIFYSPLKGALRQMLADCPLILTSPVKEDAHYAIGITRTSSWNSCKSR